MNNNELRFIDRLFRDLYKNPQVQHQFINKKKDFKTKSHSTHKETDKYNIIDSYISTLETVHKRAMEKEWRIDYLKSLYHNKYVIKKEDIPDSYYKNQERLALERGFGHRVLLEEEKERMQQEIIDNQTSSLDVWLDYFLSEDAKFYPFWAKYWAFQGMLKLGSYDKTKRTFNKRTKETVSPFADLNREALAKSIDLIIKYVGKEEIEEKELEVIVERGSFQTVYPYVLEYILKNNNSSSIKRNEGKWIKYNQGSDHMPLVKSLQGYNTGWCTAGESTARLQLQKGDFYVYYTLDENNEYKVPRIAIRMEQERIGEIRGIAKDQNIEPEMEEIVDDKIKDFPDKEKYYKKVSDMKKLTEIYYKHKHKAELTVEELRFLYEIDSKIEGFGYDKDSRIEEIIDERGKAREDLAKVLNCNTSQIAFSKKELKNDTIYYYGSIDLSEITNGKGISLPQYIRENLHLSGLKSAEGLTLPKNVGGDLYLRSLKSTEGLTLPQNVGGCLALNSLESAEGLTLPQNVGGTLYLSRLERAKGLTLPQNVGGNLDLRSLERAEDLTPPQNVGGNLDLSSLKSAEGLTLPQNVGGDLDLSSLKSAEGLTLPQNVGGDLDLSSLERAENLTIPRSIGDSLYLNNLKSAEGLTMPQKVEGDLDLGSLKSAEGLTLPQNVGGDLYLRSLKSAEGLTLPQNVGGYLSLRSLESAEGLTLPRSIGDSLYLNNLKSAEGLVLPESVGGYLDLSSLKSAEGLTLPQEVGRDLYLNSLESAEGLVLPKSIGGHIVLGSLKSAEGLTLPQEVGRDLDLSSLENAEGLIFPEPLTYTIYCAGFKITPENVDNYRKKTSTK